jgi:hypothetical protein
MSLLASFQSKENTSIMGQSTLSALTLPSTTNLSTKHTKSITPMSPLPHTQKVWKAHSHPQRNNKNNSVFCDINSALVNILEAIQNAPSNQKMKTITDKEDIQVLKLEFKTELKRELKAELTNEFKKEMANYKEDIITTANVYAKRQNIETIAYKRASLENMDIVKNYDYGYKNLRLSFYLIYLLCFKI